MKIKKLLLFINKKPKGFTLVEIVIAAYIFLVVVLLGTATFGYTVGTKSKTAVMRNNQRTARYVLEALTREVRYASQEGTYTGPSEAICNMAVNPKACGYMTLKNQLPNDPTAICEKNTQANINDVGDILLIFYCDDNNQCIKDPISGDEHKRTKIIKLDETRHALAMNIIDGFNVPPAEITGGDFKDISPSDVSVERVAFSGYFADTCVQPTLEREPYLNIELTISNVSGPEQTAYKDTLTVSTTVTTRNYKMIFY